MYHEFVELFQNFDQNSVSVTRAGASQSILISFLV